MMTDDRRRLAGDWHSGQWSPLYAYSSSGAILPGAAAEARRCAREAPTPNQRAELEELAEHLAEQEPRAVTFHLRGPWAELEAGLISDVSAVIWSHRVVYPHHLAADITSGPTFDPGGYAYGYAWTVEPMRPDAAASVLEDAARYLAHVPGAELDVELARP